VERKLVEVKSSAVDVLQEGVGWLLDVVWCGLAYLYAYMAIELWVPDPARSCPESCTCTFDHCRREQDAGGEWSYFGPCSWSTMSIGYAEASTTSSRTTVALFTAWPAG